jgi:hypothetical protein
MSARSFFEKYLRPNFEDWMVSPIDERRAMNAILSLNQMTDWFYHEIKSNPSQLALAASVSDLRKHLAQNECSDFQLIWDVADAHKHFKLDRKSAKVIGAEMTSIQKTQYVEEGYWDDGYVEDEDELVVDLGSGDLRSIIVFAQRIYEMWERLLAKHGL